MPDQKIDTPPKKRPSKYQMGFTIRLTPKEATIFEALADSGGHKSVAEAFKVAALRSVENPLEEIRAAVSELRSAVAESAQTQLRIQLEAEQTSKRLDRIGDENGRTQTAMAEAVRDLSLSFITFCRAQPATERPVRPPAH